MNMLRSGTDGTRARRASGQPADAVAYAAAIGGRHGRHLERMTSHQTSDSVNR